MTLNRKEFCTGVLGGSAVLLFPGCGGGGDYAPAAAPAPAPAPAACGASGNAIAGNHGHELTIPRADLDAQVAMSYAIRGSADHDHQVSLSPAQLAALKAGQAVVVVSTSTNAHTHQVTAAC